jgi:antitoxin component YwqK of YwqJK toxin-antitoxin module
MKKIVNLISFIVFLINGSMFAQEDSNLGIFIDGVKVTELPCYSFGKMTIVFPYNEAYSKFDFLRMKLFVVNPKDNNSTLAYSYADLNTGIISTIRRGNYIVYELISENKQESNSLAWTYGSTTVTRGSMQYALRKDEVEAAFLVQVFGTSPSGSYEESYNAGCNCVKKQVVYNLEKVYSSPAIPLKNRTKVGFITYNISQKEVDLKQPCAVNGTKVDFTALGGKSNSTPAKSEEKIVENSNPNSTKTNAASATKTTPILKPLDKTKPGYFSENDGDHITLEGYKKGDKLNGEVRVYSEGKIREISMYINDEKNGPATFYYDNGKIEMAGNMKNNEKDGEWKEYGDDGKLRSTKKYLNGEVQD